MKKKIDNIEALVPLQIQDGEKPTVNARDLHAFLEVGKDFSNWIKGRISEFHFADGEDFVCSPNLASKGRGGHNKNEYHLSLDMAKELSMVERNEKGRQARRYFIRCEDELHHRASEARHAPRNIEQLSRLLGLGVAPELSGEMLRAILPLSEFGSLSRNGSPRIHLRRSAFVASPGRSQAARLLELQLQFIELLMEREFLD